MTRHRRRFRATPAFAALLALSACEDTPAPAPVATTTQPAPPPSGPQPVASAAGPFANDPSAPANTPLCGTAGRERAALAQSLMPRQIAEAGQCASYACYDAATATYIGADGYRHVCR